MHGSPDPDPHQNVMDTDQGKKVCRLSNFGRLTGLSPLSSKYLGRYRTRRVEDAPRLPVTESCRRMSSFCSTQVDSQGVLSGDVPPPAAVAKTAVAKMAVAKTAVAKTAGAKTAVEKTAVVRTRRIARRPLALTVSTVCLCGMIGRDA
jgi:hypothetical protein